jgi:phosphatidylglycerophosphatase A
VTPRSDADSRPLVAIACSTVFGVGYVPVAPGTAGSAVGLLLWWLMPPVPAIHLAVIALLSAVGIWSATAVAPHFGKADPGHVVIDEVVGVLITLLWNPVGLGGGVAAFFLFRFFDIVKPFPARRLERLHGGLGVMADDAMAAVYANVVLRICLRFLS